MKNKRSLIMVGFLILSCAITEAGTEVARAQTPATDAGTSTGGSNVSPGASASQQPATKKRKRLLGHRRRARRSARNFMINTIQQAARGK